MEEDALGLADLLRQASGVPWGDLGISGSLLVGMHQLGSDVDLVVYGEAAGRAVHAALRRLLDDPAGPLRHPNQRELAALHATHRPDTPLSFADFCRLQQRKVNEGRFRQRPFFIRFVKHLDPPERYGEHHYQFIAQATIRATISEDDEAIFTPCRYGVEHAVPIEGPPVDDLREIVSFRGRFSDQARSGEVAEGRGRLERVVPRTGETYHRLVVGGQAGDYLLAGKNGTTGQA